MAWPDTATLYAVGKNVPPEIAHPLIMERIKRNVTITESGCWYWNRSKNFKGYPMTYAMGRKWHTHRLVLHISQRPLGPGEQACHKCDNPSCVNPGHLYIGTNSTNQADAVRKGRKYERTATHCRRGHAYDEANTYVITKDRGRYARACKACAKINQRLRLGWSLEDAIRLPTVPHGYRRGSVSSSEGYPGK